MHPELRISKQEIKNMSEKGRGKLTELIAENDHVEVTIDQLGYLFSITNKSATNLMCQYLKANGRGNYANENADVSVLWKETKKIFAS